MKTFRLLFSLVAGLTSGGSASAQDFPAPIIPPTNPPGVLQQRVGATDIDIQYNRPGVKGRKIFGGLIPYGQIWRTGSDTTTKLTLSTPVTLNGTALAAGTYELFTIPGETEWTIILQQNKSQWGSYAYDPVNDVARISAKPEKLPEIRETFTITIGDLTADSAMLNLEWEKTRVPVLLKVDVVGRVVPQIEATMAADGRKPYFAAAMFYFENEIDLDKAAEWMRAAIAQRPGHIGMLHRLALILAKKGDRAGALAAAQESLAGAGEAAPELKEEYTRLNTALIKSLQ